MPTILSELVRGGRTQGGGHTTDRWWEALFSTNYRLVEDGQSEAGAVVWQNDYRKGDRTMATSSDIFISYSRPDRDRIRPLVEALQDDGWSVWWDRNILPGQPWSGAIQSALYEAKCVIVFWSQSSIESMYVCSEARAGLSRKITVF